MWPFVVVNGLHIRRDYICGYRAVMIRGYVDINAGRLMSGNE
jgi:hypothetical protein